VLPYVIGKKKVYEEIEERLIFFSGVAGLKATRCDKSKGPLIGPSLFYTSKLY